MERLPFDEVRKREAVLNARQREALELVARGKTNAEIGETLGITFYGAKWHVSEIREARLPRTLFE